MRTWTTKQSKINYNLSQPVVNKCKIFVTNTHEKYFGRTDILSLGLKGVSVRVKIQEHVQAPTGIQRFIQNKKRLYFCVNLEA